MVEQNPFKLHINMHFGWHICCKHKNFLYKMLGSWQSWSEVMTLNKELLQHCMWRVVIVWEKKESLRVMTSDQLCQEPSLLLNKFLCLQQKCYPWCMFKWNLKGFYSTMFWQEPSNCLKLWLTCASKVLHDLMGLLGSQRTKPLATASSSMPLILTLMFSPPVTLVTSMSSDHSWSTLTSVRLG